MGRNTKLAIIVGGFALSGALLTYYATAERAGADEGARMHLYLCQNPECANEYVIRPGDDIGGRELWECPACGHEAEHASRCPACSRFSPLTELGRYELTCPHCGAAMPSLVEQLRAAEQALGGP